MKLAIKLFVAFLFVFSIAHAKEFVIDTAHTNVGFSIKHLMISNVKGNFETYTGDIDFDPASKTFKTLTAKIDAASINTDNAKRDEHLRSADFFDVAKFKTIEFAMTGMKDSKMMGNLTIHGITKEVVLDTTLHGMIDFQGKKRIGFTLEGKINRKDFGLSWNKVLESGGLVVDETVRLVIDIEAIEL